MKNSHRVIIRQYTERVATLQNRIRDLEDDNEALDKKIQVFEDQADLLIQHSLILGRIIDEKFKQ